MDDVRSTSDAESIALPAHFRLEKDFLGVERLIEFDEYGHRVNSFDPVTDSAGNVRFDKPPVQNASVPVPELPQTKPIWMTALATIAVFFAGVGVASVFLRGDGDRTTHYVPINSSQDAPSVSGFDAREDRGRQIPTPVESTNAPAAAQNAPTIEEPPEIPATDPAPIELREDGDGSGNPPSNAPATDQNAPSDGVIDIR